MDYHYIIFIAASIILIVGILKPIIRYRLHLSLFKDSQFKTGAPSIVCAKCKITTYKFAFQPHGGAICSKCAGWD